MWYLLQENNQNRTKAKTEHYIKYTVKPESMHTNTNYNKIEEENTIDNMASRGLSLKKRQAVKKQNTVPVGVSHVLMNPRTLEKSNFIPDETGFFLKILLNWSL